MGKGGSRKIELMWPGKYDDNGGPQCSSRPRLPLVVRERCAASGDVSAAQATWRNKLIWGDNLSVLDALLPEQAGTIDLIYIDPPFATGNSFFLASEERAYRDTWGQGLSSYLSMLWPRLRLMHELLSATGSMYVHIGWE